MKQNRKLQKKDLSTTLYRSLSAAFLMSSIVGSSYGQAIYESQKNLPSEIDSVVNPRPTGERAVRIPILPPPTAPAARDTLSQDSVRTGVTPLAPPKTEGPKTFSDADQFKVIVGVIDDGVDYTHPLLSKHAVFKRDAEGKAIGFGWDFVGEDSWAHPRYGRSNNDAVWKSLLMVPSADIQNAAMILGNLSYFFQRFSNVVKKKYPGKYDSILENERIVEFEGMQFATHGTMVAGLASYDDDDIGIAGYKVFPAVIDLTEVLPSQEGAIQSNSVFSTGLRKLLSWARLPDRFKSSNVFKIVGTSKANAQGAVTIDPYAQTFIDAVDKAVADGARVINMSFGGAGDRAWARAMIEKIRSYPQVAFVAAAGNEGIWTSNQSGDLMGVGPCGGSIPANMICVGALKEGQKLADFTSFNIDPRNKLVFARGTNVTSTSAVGWCDGSELDRMLTYSLDPSYAGGRNVSMTDDAFDQVLEGLDKCVARRNMVTADGTSFSSPLVARLVAQIMKRSPTMDGATAIDTLLGFARDFQEGIITSKRILIPKPSWMNPAPGENYERRTGGRKPPRSRPKQTASFSFDYNIGTKK